MQAKSSCENLNTNVISLRAERVLLEQDLAIKSKELEALTDILSQTKEQLFQSMIDQHNLRFALNKEQRSVKVLENQKNKLINEVCIGSIWLCITFTIVNNDKHCDFAKNLISLIKY